MRNKIILFSLAVTLAMLLNSCEQELPTDLTQTGFIPRPVSVTAGGESFSLNNKTTISYNLSESNLEAHATYLANKIFQISGFNPDLTESYNQPRKGIYLTMAEDEELGEEGYELIIEKRRIIIKANTPAGVFYGIQSLLQTMPVKVGNESEIKIATGTIRDYPDYAYRGAMLDVSRHFFGVEDVKRVIDFLAMYKMNTLHLHLSDDQGWRIEIKSWPKLTEIGGSTEVGGGEGGFYTQDQFKEIVNYAMEREITIVPEIDMPGHTNAALASYAELNCDGKARELYTGMKVGFSTLCTDNEITYEFVDDVVREISAISPGPYFHIGGDESHVTAHDDYVYFVNRVQDIVTKYGKKIIGWDEIANASLVDGATVQFWADLENTNMALDQGAKVIMSPAIKAYLDMKYDSTTQLGLNWAGYIEVDTAYAWNPVDMVPGITKESILGVESPLWTETIETMNDIEYMMFPRLPGYAEIGWTAAEKRSWDEYKNRLAMHGPRFEAMNIDFYRSALVPWVGKQE